MKDEETKNEDAEESESEVDEKCKRKEESEAVEVRDVTYNLENLISKGSKGYHVFMRISKNNPLMWLR